MTSLNPVIDTIYSNGFESLFVFFILGMIRSIGLLYGFVIIRFSISQLKMTRIAVAFAISLPLWVSNALSINAVIHDEGHVFAIAVAIKEFGIGYSIGFIASLPFFAVQYAAAITDQTRGEGNPSFQAGNGDTLSSFALLYTVIAFLVFLFSDGFMIVVEALYSSYIIWPLGSLLPGLDGKAASVALEILSDTLLMAVKIAVPLLAVILIIEVSFGIAARVARPFSPYNLAFITKNIVGILCLPIIVALLIAVLETLFPSADGILRIFAAFLK